MHELIWTAKRFQIYHMGVTDCQGTSWRATDNVLEAGLKRQSPLSLHSDPQARLGSHRSLDVSITAHATEVF